MKNKVEPFVEINLSRNDFISKGAEHLENELDKGVDYFVEFQNRTELKNIDILSSNILQGEYANRKVKKQIANYKSNLNKIIYGVAKYIEDKKFSSVNEAVSNLNLATYDKNRVSKLLNFQKKLSFSFETLNVVIELFSAVNESLLDKIKSSESQYEKTDLFLKNAILVYELIDFTHNFIIEYNLDGTDDIKNVKMEALEEIERTTKDDEILKEKLSNSPNVSERTKKMVEQDIESRNSIRELVKEKWKDFDHKILAMQEGVKSAQSITFDLDVLKDNARNHINILHIIAAVQVLEKNIEVVKSFSHIKDVKLAPLTPEDACNLLGITVKL